MKRTNWKGGQNPGGGYPVGYGRPPAHSRFQKGQSGNKRGRPRGSRNAATLFRQILNQSVPLREGDRVRMMSKLEAMFHRVIMDALKGDPKALKTVLALLREFEDTTPELPSAPRVIVSFGPDAKPKSEVEE
jgi:hypothetical protein